MLTSKLKLLTTAAAAVLFFSNAAQANTLYSSNIAPNGDNVTVADGTSKLLSNGWLYNNIRSGITAGINGNLARSGNGSMYFDSTNGTAKADIAYYQGLATPLSPSLGLLKDLDSMSYEWYRDSSSTTTAHLHTSMRVAVDFNGAELGGYGELIYEQVYDDANLSSGQSVLTDQWVSKTITGSTKLWGSNSGIRSAFNGSSNHFYNATLDDWKDTLGDAWILGFSSGSGSGWNGTYKGAVDNMAWTINGETTTTNFEMVSDVPLPASAYLLMSAIAGLFAAKRKAK